MHEHFFILCREPSAATSALVDALGGLGTVILISDRACGTGSCWIPDEMMTGFAGLPGWSPECPSIAAWSRAWRFIAGNEDSFEQGAWFVEDDVAFEAHHVRELVSLTRDHSPDLASVEIRSRSADPEWPHWHLADSHFAAPYRSFNPLCHLSNRLLRAVLQFRQLHRGFAFQEILYASLSAQLGYTSFDWERHPRASRLFGTYHYRPPVEPDQTHGIRHPVKHRLEPHVPPAPAPAPRAT